MEPAETGIVFNIQRFSLHDGPGIRTTIFLKGCNVRCVWCHNPESFVKEPQLSVNMNKCISCGACARACPFQVHTITEEGEHQIHWENCRACGECALFCPCGILSIIGKEYTSEELIRIAARDAAYYKSGGGVTFSGGEPTCQPGFLLSLLMRAKDERLHVCLDTNGLYAPSLLAKFDPYVDAYLLDYKISDAGSHRKYVGVPFGQIERTLRTIDDMGGIICLRCPIIPGINDTDAHFDSIRRLRALYPAIKEIELMPYHWAGVSKWENIGLRYMLNDTQAPDSGTIEDWNRKLGLQNETIFKRG
ncbi:MAG: glycyl-radical enzyme activating protein [Clostridiales bacterium]|jgi:pyruvate formate lyase activating enzyme|nr:glycyl-radical enzyme activating protein [Clostridiales bacterium]